MPKNEYQLFPWRDANIYTAVQSQKAVSDYFTS